MKRIFGIAILVLAAGFSSALTLANNDLVGDWNIAGTYATAIGYGDATFANATPPFGERTGGTHVRVFREGVVDTDAVDGFNALTNSFVVHPSGLFLGSSADGSLTSLLTDTQPSIQVVGTLSDTASSPDQAFISLILRAGGTDDLLVGLRPNSLDETTALGNRLLVGSALRMDAAETTSEHKLFTIRRLNDTQAVVRVLNLDSSALSLDTVVGTFDTSGANGGGGVFLFHPDTTTYAYGSVLLETGAQYRILTTADTALSVIVRDTAGVSSNHAHFVAFAVQPDPNARLSDLFGPWQVGAIWPESGAMNGVFGFFEFKGDGTAVFDNGVPDPLLHYVTACTYVLTSDTIQGVVNGGLSYFELHFRPDSASAVQRVRSYLSANGRFIAAAGNQPADNMIIVGMKRSSSVEENFDFGVAETAAVLTDLAVGFMADTGAFYDTPNISFSPIDTYSARLVIFNQLRDTTLINLGVSAIAGAVSIIPDTSVISPDSITITIDVTGSDEDTGGGGFLIPLVYDETSATWQRIGEGNVVSRAAGVVSFHPPHLSDFGVAGLSLGSSSAGSSGGCVIERAGAPDLFMGAMRSLRDLVAESVIGRILALIYYAF